MRLRLALAAALAIVCSLFGASPALASGYQPQFDPQSANVPYLAWRGESIRLAFCETSPWSTGDSNPQYTATWSVLDWSNSDPALAPTQSQVVQQGPNALYKNAHCARIDYTSQRAGLALIHVDITYGPTIVASHDFLAGWLTLDKVALDDGSGGTAVYDAPGWGSHNWLRAEVTGELPLSGFSDLYCPHPACIPGLPPSIHLPTEDRASQPAGDGDPTTWWDDIAKRLARTTSTDPFYAGANAWRMWDIHDDMTDRSGNVDADAATSSSSPGERYSGPCDSTGVDFAPIADTSIDAVDNCQGGLAEEGPYSRIWPSLTTGLPIGPWDPLRWDETFLGDGKLDAGDVPMPSARVDFAIAANSGAPTDISGAGTLQALSKEDVYIRDASAGHDAPHNLYAPFYRAYIPATLAELAGRQGMSSGTDWQGGANNYPTTYNCATHRTQGDDCSYPFWDKDATLSSVVGGATRCTRDFQNGTPEWRHTPTGDQGIATYSDEHGEAMVAYVPGWDFYYDALIAANPGIVTPGNGCDLGDVYPLGRAQVNATARYPGTQGPLMVDVSSNPVNEFVDNYFTRSVSCDAKGTSATDRLSQICTATSVDIDNTAIQGANVCFTVTGAGTVKPYPAGTASTTDAQGRLCETTDWSGEAQIEIVGSCASATTPVKVDFVDDKIQRSGTADLSYCPSTTTTSTTTTTPTTTTTTTRTTTTTPRTTTTTPATTTTTAPPASTTTTVTTTTTTSTTTPKPPAGPKVALVRIQVVSFGKRSRYVNVRVNGTPKTVKIEVRLVKVNGKTLRRVLRVVPTNRVVRVPKLKLDKIVKTVKVKLAA